MSDKELAKDIVVALIGQHTTFLADEDCAESAAKAFEIIYNQIHNTDTAKYN